jgi:hypothetical protein
MRDSWGISGTGETPNGAKRRGGSPHAPRKASILERKSTTFKCYKDYENSPLYKHRKNRESPAFFILLLRVL